MFIKDFKILCWKIKHMCSKSHIDAETFKVTINMILIICEFYFKKEKLLYR